MPFIQTSSGFRRSLRPPVVSVIFSISYFLMKRSQRFPEHREAPPARFKTGPCANRGSPKHQLPLSSCLPDRLVSDRAAGIVVVFPQPIAAKVVRPRVFTLFWQVRLIFWECNVRRT